MKVRNRPRVMVAVVALLVTVLTGCGSTGDSTAERDLANSGPGDTPSVSTAPSADSPSASASRPSSTPSPSATPSSEPAALCKDLGFMLRAAKDLRRLGEPAESTGNQTTDEHMMMFAFMEAQSFARTMADSGEASTSRVPASLRGSVKTMTSAGSQVEETLVRDQDMTAAVAVMKTAELRAAEKEVSRFKRKTCDARA